MEFRYTNNAQMRADTESRKVSGYGIVFNSDSHPLSIHDSTHGTVRVVEQITRESLAEADMEDVISAYNHNFEKVLGRTTSKTMSLSIDDNGVKYTVQAGNQSYATDLLESLQRGDVSGSSFVFTYDASEGYELQDREDGVIVAIPKKITKVYEMGPVTNPQYPETTAENRSGAIEDAVKRHLDAKKKQEQSRPDLDEEEEPKPDAVEERAMDVTDMSEIVCDAFYEQFDWKEEYDYAYFYVQSVMVDNTMVAKEYPGKRLWKLSFSISDDLSVTFDSRESWEQVQKEFVPVRAWQEKEVVKRAADEQKDVEKRTDTTGLPSNYYQIKAAINKRV